MREINEIIVHCSATKPSHRVGAATIRKWHVEGNGWADIGYHFVIKRGGALESGRPVSKAGAHCRGRNAHSIGICLVGGVAADGSPDANFTFRQYDTLVQLIGQLRRDHGNVPVTGHRDYANKACPSFDVKALLGQIA